MIEVTRTNYPRRTFRVHGREVVEEARHECRYFYKGQEIAFYTSKWDCLYLKTDLIGNNFKLSAYERALSCKIKEAYRYLFDMIGADQTSKISEYTGI